MNPKVEVRSLKERPEICDGNCGVPLGTHRTVTVDKHGNPMRFGDTCGCFRLWSQVNATGFNKRGTALATA